MFKIRSMACERQILFHPALNFSPDCPHPAARYGPVWAKFALAGIKFPRSRLIIEI